MVLNTVVNFGYKEVELTLGTERYKVITSGGYADGLCDVERGGNFSISSITCNDINYEVFDELTDEFVETEEKPEIYQDFMDWLEEEVLYTSKHSQYELRGVC